VILHQEEPNGVPDRHGSQAYTNRIEM
jgi:hypothetical protein